MAKALSKSLSAPDVSRLIEMAWEDRTPFEVIELMRRELQRGSFKLWRERVSGRVTKHSALRDSAVKRAYCPTQYKNK